MKILVTGGAGFIGSRVALRLAKKGHNVHILDNLSTGDRSSIPEQAVFHQLDIRDQQIVSLFDAERFEVMVHTAAQLDVRRSVESPQYDAEVNILGFLNLMEAGRKSGLKKVIFSSTGGAIYGEPIDLPQREEHPLKPVSPYGITKLATENYLHYYEKTYGILPVVLRYSNVYGPGQRSDGEGGVIAIFSRMMLQGEPPIIFGDGNQTRDFVYIDDVVDANLLAMQASTSGSYNVCTGVETSINDLFHLLKQFVPSVGEPEYRIGRSGEQLRSLLAYDKIQKGLGWSPAIAIEQGLERTIMWFKSRMGDVA